MILFSTRFPGGDNQLDPPSHTQHLGGTATTSERATDDPGTGILDIEIEATAKVSIFGIAVAATGAYPCLFGCFKTGDDGTDYVVDFNFKYDYAVDLRAGIAVGPAPGGWHIPLIGGVGVASGLIDMIAEVLDAAGAVVGSGQARVFSNSAFPGHQIRESVNSNRPSVPPGGPPVAAGLVLQVPVTLRPGQIYRWRLTTHALVSSGVTGVHATYVSNIHGKTILRSVTIEPDVQKVACP